MLTDFHNSFTGDIVSKVPILAHRQNTVASTVECDCLMLKSIIESRNISENSLKSVLKKMIGESHGPVAHPLDPPLSSTAHRVSVSDGS